MTTDTDEPGTRTMTRRMRRMAGELIGAQGHAPEDVAVAALIAALETMGDHTSRDAHLMRMAAQALARDATTEPPA